MLYSRRSPTHPIGPSSPPRPTCRPTSSPGCPMQLPAYERDADTLLTALVRARYLEASGRWPTLALTPAYERFPELTSLDAYEQLLDVEPEERIAGGLQRLALGWSAGAEPARHDQWIA